jgi:hypothetical protein
LSDVSKLLMAIPKCSIFMLIFNFSDNLQKINDLKLHFILYVKRTHYPWTFIILNH